MPAGRSTLRIGSRAAATREPRQVRKEAAINAARRVPRIGLVRAGLFVGHANVPVDGGCTAKQPTLRGDTHRRGLWRTTAMLTMAVGQSDDVEPAVAIAEAIDQCRATLQGRDPQAGILFIAFDSFDPSLPEAVRDAFPGIELIGSTSGAEMSSAFGYLEDSIALAVFASDDVDLAVGWGSGAEVDAAQAAQTAVAQALARTTKDPKVCIVLTEANTGQRVAEALREILPPEVLIIGGAAGRARSGRDDTTSSAAAKSPPMPSRFSSWPGPSCTPARSGQAGEPSVPAASSHARATARSTRSMVGPRPIGSSGYMDLSAGSSTFGNPLAVKDAGVDDWYLRVVIGNDEVGIALDSRLDPGGGHRANDNHQPRRHAGRHVRCSGTRPGGIPGRIPRRPLH